MLIHTQTPPPFGNQRNSTLLIQLIEIFSFALYENVFDAEQGLSKLLPKNQIGFFLTFWNHHLKTFWQLPIGVSYDVENDLINFKAFLVKWKIKDIIPTNIMQRTKRYQNIPDNMDEAYFTNATVTTMGAIFNCFSARYTFNSIF